MAEKNVQVAVIGAGLAGLAAARKLQVEGVDYELFEANPTRVGGRVWTVQFENGQTSEHGAERIDTKHTHMLALAEEFGLDLDDHLEQNEHEAPSVVRYKGMDLDNGKAIKERQLIADILKAQIAEQGIVYSQGNMAGTTSQAAIALDALSVREWIQAFVPGGAGSEAGSALLGNVTELTGRDPEQVSAMALLDEWDTLIGFVTGDFNDPDADARWRVRGGNDQIPNRLLATLQPERVHLGARLKVLTRADETGFTLRFEGHEDIHAQAVVIAIPFSALRKVDTSGAGFSEIKSTIIRELEMGAVAKLHMQFNGRVAEWDDWSGYFFNEMPAFTSFESTRRQDGDTMNITAYLGGSFAATLPIGTAHGSSPATVVDALLETIDAAVPGMRERFTGVTSVDAWADDEFIHGAYSVLRPGQYTRFLGIIGDPEDGVFFAGEHTSKKHRGFMNGAVETGERAASEAVDRLAKI